MVPPCPLYAGGAGRFNARSVDRDGAAWRLRAPDDEGRGGDGAGRPGLAGGAALGLLAVALEKLTALGIALYLPRHLGLDDYGRYALLVSYLGLFQALPDASLEAVLVTQLARAGGSTVLAGKGTVVRIGVSVVGAAAALASLAAATGDASLVRAGGVAALALAASALNPYRVLLRSRLELGRYLALVAGQAALGIGLLVVVVRAGGGLVEVFAALAVAALGGLVLGRLLFGGGLRIAADGVLARALVRDAWPLAGTTAALTAAQQVLSLVLLRGHGAAPSASSAARTASSTRSRSSRRRSW